MQLAISALEHRIESVYEELTYSRKRQISLEEQIEAEKRSQKNYEKAILSYQDAVVSLHKVEARV